MEVINQQPIENKIFTVRNMQVMLDSDLAMLYGTETKFINRAVKRNPNRFPESFVLDLTETEWKSIRFQSGTLNTEAVRHPMWVEIHEADAIPSPTGRNKPIMGRFFYPHLIPNGTALLLNQLEGVK